MVIDAGSSHTTIYLYKLRVGPIMGEVEEIDKQRVDSEFPNIKMLCCCYLGDRVNHDRPTYKSFC